MNYVNLQFIKNRRIELGKSQQELAESLGLKNASTYLKYENGTYLFRAEQLPVLAKALECKITDFFKQDVSKIAT